MKLIEKLNDKNSYKSGRTAGLIAFGFSIFLPCLLGLYAGYGFIFTGGRFEPGNFFTGSILENLFEVTWWFFFYYILFFLLWMILAVVLSLVIGPREKKLFLRKTSNNTMVALLTQMTWSTLLVVLLLYPAVLSMVILTSLQINTDVSKGSLVLPLILFTLFSGLFTYLFKSNKKIFYLLLSISGVIAYLFIIFVIFFLNFVTLF